MTNELTTLIYVSKAFELELTSAEVINILQASERNNLEYEITGMLVCDFSHFLQVLEGPAANVDSLYELIKKDPRHYNARVLKREPITERSFSDWAMGFATVKTAVDFEALTADEANDFLMVEASRHRAIGE